MAHIFNPKNKRKLNSEIRRELLPPKEILEKLYIKKDDIVADIGCGIGYFTFPAAELVGDKGKVYAIDISDEMLKDVREKIKEENLKNVEVVKGEIKDIENDGVTYAFVSTVLHEVSNKLNFVEDVKKKLKNNGKLIVLEWEKKIGEFGPPVDHRLSKEYVKDLLVVSGFSNVELIKLNSEFYSVVGSYEK